MNSGGWTIGALAMLLLMTMFAPVSMAEPLIRNSTEREHRRADDFRSGWRGPDEGRGPYRRGGRDEARDERGERDAPRPHRLSPEERSRLRRDIRDAGREIYPHRHH